MQPISFFGIGMQSYSQAVNAQRRLNCIYEMRDDGDKSGMIIRGTPGLTLFANIPAGVVRGMRVVKGVLYCVAYNSLYSVSTTGAVTQLSGTIGTTSGNVCLSDNGIQVIIVDGLGGYVYTISSGVLSKIADSQFPNGAKTVTFAGGYFICELPNTLQWYVSKAFDGTTWTPLVFASKQQKPDTLQAVDSMHDTLVLFGTTSIEFWQNTGGYPNPFSRISGSTQDWGLAAIYSRCSFNNSMAFLAQNTQGQIQVVTFNGYTVTRISTHDIENVINDFVTIADAVGYSYMWDGHILYQLTFPSAGRSFLYDALTGFWSEVQTGISLAPQRHVGQFGVVYNYENYITDYSNGNIYMINDDVYSDNGNAIMRQVQSKHIRNKGNELAIAEVFFDMETGQGVQYGQGTNPQLIVQVSKDNGRTFGNERWAPLGAVGNYYTRVILTRWGSAIDFVFRLTMTDPVPFIITEACAVIPERIPS